MNFKFIILISAFFLTGCSSPSKELSRLSEPQKAGDPQGPAQPTIEAKQAAAETGAAQVAELRFGKGLDKLTNEHRKQIAQALTDARKAGEVAHVTVATWGDSDNPSDPLIKKRTDTIVRFVEDQIGQNIEVQSLNMNDQSGRLAQIWGTEKAKLEESLNRSSRTGKGTALVLIRLGEN
jgi:hypothetical protein